MFVHSKNGQAHLICYLLHGLIVHPTQKKCATALNRQAFDNSFQAPQLIACLQSGFCRVVDRDQVQIGNQCQRHDLLTPCLIDDHVAGDLEKISTAMNDVPEFRRRESSRHRLGDQVVEVVAARQNPPHPLAQCGLMREDRLLKPIELFPDRFHSEPPFRSKDAASPDFSLPDDHLQ